MKHGRSKLIIRLKSTQVTTELVTNNAAAALGVPLAIDLAEKMGLHSPHPLVP